MTERQALVKAMLAEPDDDLPRLVFADWLDEHGESERATFTRLQVEAAKRPLSEQGELLRQAGGYVEKHWDDLVGPLLSFSCTLNEPQYLFQRGMLFALAIREDEFIRPEVQTVLAAWAADNGIERLALTRDPYPSVRASWSRLGTLAGVLVNTLRGKYADGERPVLEVAASPVLASVASLAVTGPTTDDHSLRVLAHSPHVGLLSGLTLNDPHCTDAGLDALARTQHLPNLRALNLNVNNLNNRARFTLEGVMKVLASGRLPKFTSLGLDVPPRFDLARILNHPAAGRLTSLRLNGEDALVAVARSRQLTRLETLELIGRRVVLTSEGVAELLANPNLTALRKLWSCTSTDNLRLTPDDHARLRDRFGDGYTTHTI